MYSEFFITAWDDTTDVYCGTSGAVKRGVRSGCFTMTSHLAPIRVQGDELEAHRCWDRVAQMVRQTLRGKWRRPDLRNHRKLLVVDGKIAFMGSQT